MRAIVNSIHSQVPATVAELGSGPDTIVSMDSHLDVSLGGDDGLYPPALRMIVARTSAHSELRRISGGLPALGHGSLGRAPELVVVVPEAMLARHALDVESRLPPSLRVSDRDESVSSAVRFLAETMGIEVYRSPPRSLRPLASRMARADSWLLDVDVDYMEEMQRECYTRIIDPAPGVLQQMSRVVGFIREARPETITVSEAKVAAIRDPESQFSRFVAALKDMGYDVEERGVFAGDAEVLKGIRVCREFYRTVSSRLTLAHMDEMMKGDVEGFRREEAAAAKKFFREKGYV